MHQYALCGWRCSRENLSVTAMHCMHDDDDSDDDDDGGGGGGDDIMQFDILDSLGYCNCSFTDFFFPW